MLPNIFINDKFIYFINYKMPSISESQNEVFLSTNLTPKKGSLFGHPFSVKNRPKVKNVVFGPEKVV